MKNKAKSDTNRPPKKGRRPSGGKPPASRKAEPQQHPLHSCIGSVSAVINRNLVSLAVLQQHGVEYRPCVTNGVEQIACNLVPFTEDGHVCWRVPHWLRMNLARLEVVLVEGWNWNGQKHSTVIDPDTLEAVRTCEANYASVKDSAALGDLPFSAKPEFVAVVEEYRPVIVAVTDAAGKTIKTLQAELRYDAKHGVARLYTRQVDVINMHPDLFESELQSYGTSD